MNSFTVLIGWLIQTLVMGNVACVMEYECGQHGRFEYCIDEILGCVVGCHCHPGYYFDTDTKVCEPNSKLIEHHRRHNLVEPTRVQGPIPPRNLAPQEIKPPSNKNPINAEIDDISNDANNLGDWLYNQFFKTIENQVINNTNEKELPTRRSGRGLTIKPTRVNKKTKKESQKKRNKKENLKRKLMRISEDHSVFDVSSDSDSHSSESSSSRTSSETDSDEHKHKKIVMVRKKTKQPLPSFIFLPNMETPFYPPLGLPPPPVMPMYPVVPVPPVIPFYAVPATTEPQKENGSDDSAITTAETTSRKSNPTSKHLTDNDIAPSTKASTQEEQKEDPKELRHITKKRKKIPPFMLDQGGPKHMRPSSMKLKNIARQKLLHRLKENLGNYPPLDEPLDQEQQWVQADNSPIDADQLPMPETMMLNEDAMPEEFKPKPIPTDDYANNVRFKYMSELIHKFNINKSDALPPTEYNSRDNFGNYQVQGQHANNLDQLNTPLANTDITRRFNPPTNKQTENSYFTNLGRQIATLIRKNDIENRQGDETYVQSPYFDNSPRSFWERYVRSPLNVINSNKKFEYLKRSNELLYDIENKVEIIASTPRALNLQEIENIVEVIEVAKRKIESKDQVHNYNVRGNDQNFKIKLWPKETRELQIQKKTSFHPNFIPPTNSDKFEEINVINKIPINYMSAKKNIPQDLPELEKNKLQKMLLYPNKRQPKKETHRTSSLLQLQKPEIAKSFFKNTFPDHSIRRTLDERTQNMAFIPNHLLGKGLKSSLRQNRFGNSFLLTNESPFRKTMNLMNASHKQSSYIRREMSVFDFN